MIYYCRARIESHVNDYADSEEFWLDLGDMSPENVMACAFAEAAKLLGPKPASHAITLWAVVPVSKIGETG